MKNKQKKPTYYVHRDANVSFDFNQAAKEHGFVKARQLLKIASIQSTISKTETKDKLKMESTKSLRIKEAFRLSNTLGMPVELSPLQKIRDASINTQPGESEEEATKEDLSMTVKRSLISENQSLVFPQRGLDQIPIELGDTLFLQLTYLKSVSLNRNKLQNFLAHEIPQLSSRHFRYITELLLSGNKISCLPSDFGELASLRTLDLSDNMLSALPNSFSKLKNLTNLNISKNSFSQLQDELSALDGLTTLNLSENLFLQIPRPLCRMLNLKKLDLSKNMLAHLAIFPPLLRPSDLWRKTYDYRHGHDCFVNVITLEKTRRIENYDMTRMELDQALHVFQPRGTRDYKRRKKWLSISQVNEWEAAEDEGSGWTYFRNNVTGETQWEMPEDLDVIGDFHMLEELILNTNQIRSLPPSFTRLQTLRRLVMRQNRLHDLPEGIGELRNLTHLDLFSNELGPVLPSSLCDCLSLQDLNLQGNHLVRLPTGLGALPALKRLDASRNRLVQVPFSLGFCESLEELSVFENPISEPPIEELKKHITHIKWYLRNLLHIAQRSLPPVMEFQHLSINNEVSVLRPEFGQRIDSLIRTSISTGVLNLQLLGLSSLPPELLSLKTETMRSIQKLQLDFNPELRFPHGFPKELAPIKHLSFRNCRMPSLPENINIIRRLTHLNCEENRLESLPRLFGRLKSLVTLDLSKNRLYALPEDFSQMDALKSLNLEGNRLETLPESLGSFSSLVSLNLSKNQLAEIPLSIANLSDLKTLDLSTNCLLHIPDPIKHMHLTSLNIAHNKIEFLSLDMFQFQLGRSIMTFNCVENNLLELPPSLSLIHADALVTADYNPLISPPSFLLAEGLRVVQDYLRIRQLRIEEVERLLTDEDFVMDRTALYPLAFEVLEDGTGFMTPLDLQQFDQAMDEFVNGSFFECPSSGPEIVEAVSRLRDHRENEIYLLILEAMLKTLESLNDDPRFSQAVLMTTKKPWGRKGEEVDVWALSLHALLRETPPSHYHPSGRPSAMSLIRESLPPIPFPFTMDLLKDSLRLFVSPYGQIADTQQIEFHQCDCIDDQRLKPLRHNPCEKVAVLLCKVIYDDEEADRREVEEDEFLIRFEELESEIHIWLLTEEGRKCLTDELKRRKTEVKAQIALKEEMLTMEQIMLKQSKEALAQCNKRKKQFESGASFELHGLVDLDSADSAIAREEENFDKHTKRQQLLLELLVNLKIEDGMELKKRKEKAIEDIILKYCSDAYHFSLRTLRYFAADRGLRRPWDGPEGKLFNDWLKNHYAKRLMTEQAKSNLEGPQEQDSLVQGKGRPTPTPQQRERANYELRQALDQSWKDYLAQKEFQSSSVDQLEAEFTWEQTQDMARYEFSLYERYKGSRRTLMEKAGRAALDLIIGE